MRKIVKIAASYLALLAVLACTLEPEYKTPKAPELPFVTSSKERISKISWEKFFESEDVQRVVNLALDNNRDLKTADLNIKSVETIYQIERSNLFPTLAAAASETKQKVPRAFASFLPKRQYRANLSISAYELDFFGRLRSLSKSAYEDYLSTRQARNVVKITIIANTINAYAQYLADLENLRITEENMNYLEQKSEVIEKRYKHGLDAQNDYLNSLADAQTAQTIYQSYAKAVELDKNALMILTGKFSDEALPKIAKLDDIKINESLLDFVPSNSLLSRPDIQEAEHLLKSANANIGAARAAFFPTISLTATYGYGSRELGNLFDTRTWAYTPQIYIPIFTGGRNIANLKNANILKQAEIVNYEKTIQTAFRETLDQLAERAAVAKQLEAQEKILKMREKSRQISAARYKGGAASSLNEIDANLALLAAKQNHNITKKDYIANLINLYKVLGGGAELETDEKK